MKLLIAPATERAWAAGFFDGEGNFRLSLSEKEHAKLTAQIAQIDRRVLDRFQAAVSGLGKVYGPYNKANARQQPYWIFNSRNSAEAQQIAVLIWDFLDEVKREQVRTSIASWSKYYADNPNALRVNGRKVVCPRGHTYSDENTYTNPNTGHQYCKVCRRK